MGWVYVFNCRNCSRIEYLKDEIRDGEYCMAMLNGEPNIHADDDYKVRCDAYEPIQPSLFDGEEVNE